MAKKSANALRDTMAAADRGVIARLTDARFAPTVKKMRDRVGTDRSYAIKILHDAGIVTKRGNLTKRFRD